MFRNKFLIVTALIIVAKISISSKQSRKKRFTPYSPYNTGIAMAAALSLTVDNELGDIFVTICIIANYDQPTFSPLSPPPFQTIYGDSVDRKLENMDFNDYVEDKTKTKPTIDQNNTSKKRGTFKKILEFTTRRKFFKLLEHKLKKYGFDGKTCLLKAICDVSQHFYGEYNGVVGDIVHILFTPSTSKDEQIPMEYYKAEQHGNSGRCDKMYGKKCPIGIFEILRSVSPIFYQ